jgi:hypothetical protein
MRKIAELVAMLMIGDGRDRVGGSEEAQPLVEVRTGKLQAVYGGVRRASDS